MKGGALLGLSSLEPALLLLIFQNPIRKGLKVKRDSPKEPILYLSESYL